ncbi:hypothetical protein D3C73_1284720 [compost metagenome]
MVLFVVTTTGAVYVVHVVPFILYSFTVASDGYVIVTLIFPFVQPVGLPLIVGNDGAVLSILNTFDFVTTLFPALSDPLTHK